MYLEEFLISVGFNKNKNYPDVFMYDTIKTHYRITLNCSNYKKISLELYSKVPPYYNAHKQIDEDECIKFIKNNVNFTIALRKKKIKLCLVSENT